MEIKAVIVAVLIIYFGIACIIGFRQERKRKKGPDKYMIVLSKQFMQEHPNYYSVNTDKDGK